MKTKFNSALRAAGRLYGGMVCAGAVLLIASSAPAQNLFVPDAVSGNIYEFTPLGAIPAFASGLSSPYGLAFDSAGNLFVADSGSGNIYKFTPGGVRSTFASGLNYPRGLAFDSAGNLYEADASSGNIYEFTTNGVQNTFASGLSFPGGLAFDSAGNLFVADYGDNTIYEFTPGRVQSIFFNSGLNGPAGLAFDSAGNLYEAEYNSTNIFEYTPNGVQSTFASGSGLSYPLGLAFDSAGNLFVSELNGNTIYEYTTNGVQSTFFFNSGLTPTFLAFRGAVQIPGTVQTAGIYGGQVNDIIFNNPNAGVFAVFVGTNGQATVVGYDTNSANYFQSGQAGGVAAQFNVNTNGSWQFKSNNTMFGVSGSGTITSGGSFSGELDFTNLDCVLLNGSQQSPLGNFQNAAGYYSGTYSGAFSGPIIGVLSASGQLVLSIFANGAVNDGAEGQLGANNQFTTTSATGTPISGTLTNATLKIGGSATTSGGIVTFTMSRSNYVLGVATTNLPNGTTTVPYSQTLTAYGGPTNYSWAIISNGLPAGLSLSPSGMISGTPTTAGTTNFTVQVTNALGVTVKQVLLLTIDALDTNVHFNVTPSAVSNTYTGMITLQVTGLSGGEKVTIQKYLDGNSNGVIDASDLLVQQGNLKDGQVFVIDGVTNFNVPGDGNATTGAITATLNFQNGDFIQNLVGQYAFKLSSPTAHFAPLTNLFNVTNFPYAQKITGTVFSNSTATTVSNAVVLLFSGPAGNSSPQAGVVANNAGTYTIQAPPGTYSLLPFKGNFVVNTKTLPLVTLAASQTINTNLTLTNATPSISGQLVDANDSSKGLPGVLFSAKSANGLFAPAFTDTNGNFNVPVTAGNWAINADDTALIIHGYVGLQNRTVVTAGAAGVTLAAPQATALIYGTVKDNQGNPLAALDVYAYDNQNNQYQTDGYTDQNGNYVCGVLGLGASDPWQVQANGNNQLNNYVFSQPSFNQNGGTNINAGQAVQVNFIAIPTTNQITGHVQDNLGNPIVGVNIYTYGTINGVSYSPNSVDTDASGNYSFNVVNGTWTVGINYCGGGGGSDCLSTNYIQPPNENVSILNNNAVLNFTVQTNVNVGGALTVTTTSLPNGTIGLAYSQELTASGGQSLYSWSLFSGSLPSGLSLDANGFISGTPTTNGMFNFSVQVTDQLNTNKTKALTLTISADIQSPVVSIANITSGMTVSNAAFTVLGTATDNVAVASVFVSLTNSTGVGAWTLATGTNNWSAAVTLTPGTNTIRAYAVDTSGNHSTTNSVSLDYNLSAVLTVNTNGNGTVSPNYNGLSLQIGNTYSLTASAGAGFMFTNWTGGTSQPLAVLTNGPILTFVMQSNLVLQANFVETNRPVVNITNITSGMTVSNAAFTVLGTASDLVAVTNVYVSLSNAAVNTGFGPATTANNWANWSTNVTLTPGTNTIAAYAVNLVGLPSATNTVKLVYVVSAPLTVLTNGNGAISPGLNGALLQIGATYSLTASAGAGFMFTNWTGGTSQPLAVLTNGPILTFVMQSNLVLQANFVETNRPVVNITNITSGMTVSNAAFTVLGTASDLVAVTNVYVSLSNAAVNTGFGPATTANNWANWSTNVTLTPGTNTIAAYAVNLVGLPSATNTVKLVYVVSAPLTVLTNGNGAISPGLNGALLQIGATYSLTASAGAGFMFTNWTGGTSQPLAVLTNGPILTFVMQSNLVLQANFVETNRPVVNITNITSGMTVSNAAFTVLGTASDLVAVTNVYVSLSNAAVNTGFGPATTANNWANWSTNLTLTPGTNTIAAYAVNLVGLPSATNTVKLVYVVSAPLTVLTNGNGAISPGLNGALLQIGATYSLTASAGAGFMFTNWTGGTSQPLAVLTNGPILTFVMQSNLVLQANFVETNRPVVNITNITSGMTVSNAAFTVLGTASDLVAVTNVYVSLSNAAVNTGFGPATTANNWANWSTNVTLTPGTNTIAAYAVNLVGLPSATNTVKLVYVVSAPLTVLTNGNGAISPGLNGALLQIGATYSLTASAGAGFMFTNWTGGTSQPLAVLTNGPILTFVMQSNLVLQANFVETNRPVVNITNITSGMTVSNAAFTVLGTASDLVAVTNVYVSLSNAAVNTGFGPATTANNWANWSTNVTLTPGTNTIAAYAVNLVGLPSATNTVKLVYVVSAPLTVLTNGNGAISPGLNGALLQIGATYSLTASAGAGFMFTNWTGGTSQPLAVLTNGPILTFVMQSNLVLQANFVETNRPVVNITNITSGMTVSNAAFTVLGTASDLVAVTNVYVSLSNAAVNTGFGPATTANNWANWSTNVTLTPGTNTIAAYAVNLVGLPSATNTVNVVLAFQIATTSLPVGTNGFPYNAALSILVGQPPYTWTNVSGTLPAGLSLSTNGIISGTPTVAATNNLTVQVTDNLGNVASRALTLVIINPPPLQITTTSLPNGTNGVAYNQTLGATGGHPPYSWTLTTSSLPPGLNLPTNGVISGTPTANGLSSFTVKVTDAVSTTKIKPLTIVINTNTAVVRPILNSAIYFSGSQFQIQLTNGVAGQNYTLQMSTNLSSTNWMSILATNAPGGSFFITDTNATNAERFYRIWVGP